jgi:hypothetical protein
VDSEKRKYPRLPIRLDLSCRIVGSTSQSRHSGRTINVSPGGLYFQTPTNIFGPGSLLNVELSIPPTAGLLEYGGRVSGFATVMRIEDIGQSQPGSKLFSDKYGVAAQFCQPPRLSP